MAYSEKKSHQPMDGFRHVPASALSPRQVKALLGAHAGHFDAALTQKGYDPAALRRLFLNPPVERPTCVARRFGLNAGDLSCPQHESDSDQRAYVVTCLHGARLYRLTWFTWSEGRLWRHRIRVTLPNPHTNGREGWDSDGDGSEQHNEDLDRAVSALDVVRECGVSPLLALSVQHEWTAQQWTQVIAAIQ